MRDYNIIVYGVTGFTGQKLVAQLMRTIEGKNLKWAVAGRSVAKMTNTMAEISKEIGKDLSGVEKIYANSAEFDSLVKLAKKCDLIINTVGPYLLYGENVVKACAQEGTHHVDLSGEPQYLESMEKKYNDEARKTGAYIVGACGFDSVPADCGVMHLRQKFEDDGGHLNSVETFVKMKSPKNAVTVNSGTWRSGVEAAHKIMSILFSDPTSSLPSSHFKLRTKPMHYNRTVNSWCLWLPFPDERVMKRTQSYMVREEKQTLVHTRAYMQLPNFISCLVLGVAVFFITLIAQFRFGVDLLKKYPRFFSAGFFSDEGPTAEQREASKFQFTVVGKGWSDNVANPNKHKDSPNVTKILKISGKDPGYGATNIILTECALCLLLEKNLLPNEGGIYTPGIAFKKTHLLQNIERWGIQVEMS